ncbi:hypothetical protein Q9189_007283, partial [Teloschistes chrysophthalmus]
MFTSQFSIEDLPKLHTDVLKTSATDLKDFQQLMKSFEVYGQIISAFTHRSLEVDMQRALADYRMRLLEFHETYTFASIKEYHLSFVQTRILDGEDHPVKWKMVDHELLVKLIGKAQGQSSVTRSGTAAHRNTPIVPESQQPMAPGQQPSAVHQPDTAVEPRPFQRLVIHLSISISRID